MADHTTGSIEQIEDKWRKGYADMTSLYKGNVDAMLAASRAMIGGYQSLSAELLAFTQSRMKHGLETSRRLAECQSPESVFELQAEFAREAFKAYADECKKLGEMSGRTFTETCAPLNAQTKAAAVKTTESAAA